MIFLFSVRTLDRSPCPVEEMAGKKEKKCVAMQRLAWVYSYAAYLYSKKCPCRTFLAFLALLKKIFLPIFVAWK